MLHTGVRERTQTNGNHQNGVNLDYVINSIQEMQDRQNNRIEEMEGLLGQGGADEESKTVQAGGFPRVGASVPQASPNRRLISLPQYSDENSPGGYNLQAALSDDPSELLAMNERNALQRILGRGEDDIDEPLFPMARNNHNNRQNGGASRIVQEMRDERMRRANSDNNSYMRRNGLGAGR